jgi:hypothetical protein
MPDLFDDPENYPDVIAQRMVNANILAIEQP